MDISIAVAVADEPEDNRKKQGDIIAIMPSGHQWSQGEICNHLILEVALPQQVTMDHVQALMTIYYSGGVLRWDTAPPPIVAKRRFKIDWNKLKTIVAAAGIIVDWAKVENKAIPYSPLSQQDADPNSTTKIIDPTKTVFDKYEARLIKAVDFESFIT